MGQIGIWQIVIIAIVILVLFGRGRISEMMGDFGKGVSSFKKGLDDPEEPAEPTAEIEAPKTDASTAAETKTPEVSSSDTKG